MKGWNFFRKYGTDAAKGFSFELLNMSPAILEECVKITKAQLTTIEMLQKP